MTGRRQNSINSGDDEHCRHHRRKHEALILQLHLAVLNTHVLRLFPDLSCHHCCCSYCLKLSFSKRQVILLSSEGKVGSFWISNQRLLNRGNTRF
ncbi:hypothetical protein HID58_070717 [Brassica napus]|uniref:Uncharacterized protein n=1 Tax=Brassica napus TaxID=3708 RepID=A0ABQ7YZM0_BRANA|nr:hypothetical protein HID58_070717 [Brassica napus]